MATKLHRVAIVVFVWSSAAIVLPAYADLHECNETWTNKPCADGGGKSLTETESHVNNEQVRLLRAKKDLLHPIQMKALRIKEDFDFSVDTHALEQECYSEAISLDECANKVTQFVDSLDAKAIELRGIRAQEKSEAKDGSADQKEKEPTVVIVENHNNVITPKVTHHRDHDFPHLTVVPHAPIIHGDSSISVTASGSTGSGNISVEGSIGQRASPGAISGRE